MNRVITIATFLVAALLGGCEMLVDAGREHSTSANDTICVLVSANTDTYASFGRVGEEGELTFGRHGQLVVASGPLGRKQSYLTVDLPDFPEGTEVLTAKLELYHSGTNEDGRSDDITLNVGAVTNEPWNYSTLNWNNRPDRGGMPFVQYSLYLRSRAWSGTENIAGVVQRMIAVPDSIHGFMVSFPDQFMGQQYEKGFYSTNETIHRPGGRVAAPRLVMKVVMPRGAAGTLLLPAGDIEPGGIRELRTATAPRNGGWPADWGVSPDR